MKTTLTTLLTLAALALPLMADDAVIGEAAPDFTLTDTNGKEHTLSGFSGNYVVLEWINHDCPFVKKHYGTGNMQKLQKAYTARDVIWLSICSSAPGKQGHHPADKWNAMTEEKDASPTAVLLDPDGKAGRMYGAKTTPHMYIIDPQGVLIYMGAIDDKASFNPKDVETAQNYVQATLDAAMAGKDIAAKETQPYGCSVKY